MEGAGSGDFRILVVFSVVTSVLMDLLNSDLQPTLESLTAEREAAGTKISTSVFVAMVLCWKRDELLTSGQERFAGVQVSQESCSQMKQKRKKID